MEREGRIQNKDTITSYKKKETVNMQTQNSEADGREKVHQAPEKKIPESQRETWTERYSGS